MGSGKVLVTGGAGYIGVTLCERLLANGYKVIIYDSFYWGRKPISHLANNKSLTIVEGEITDTSKVASLIETGTDVIHLASLSNDPSCDLKPEWSEQVNHHATVRLAQAAKKRGGRRFVLASSCSVYGFGNNEFLHESSLCNPVSLYAQLKLKSEKEISLLADDNFSPVYLRQATIFGLSPRMRFDLAINQMTLHAITKGKIFVMGGGEQWRPFLHVRDAASLFQKCIEADYQTVHKQVFNAGSNENNFQIVELAEHVKNEIGGVEIVVTPDDVDKRNYNVDFSKVSRELGFTPGTDISGGIKEIADYIREDRNRDYLSSEFFNIQRMQELATSPFFNVGIYKNS